MAYLLNILFVIVKYLSAAIFSSDRLNFTNIGSQPEPSGVLTASDVPSPPAQAPNPPNPPRNQNEPNLLNDASIITINRIDFRCGLDGQQKCLFDRRSAGIDSILKSIEGKNITLGQLKATADRITRLYRDLGYVTSGAVLFPQNIDSGVAVITLIEGGIEKIQVTGLDRVKPKYIKSRIDLPAPITLQALNEQLRRLRTDSAFRSVDFQLLPGNRLDRVVLNVKVSEAPSIGGNIGFDNFSSPGVGSERLGVGLNFRNWSFSGDRLAAGYKISTTGGSRAYEFSYDVPLSSANDVLQVRSAITDFKITDPQLIAFDINGKSSQYELNYRRPLIRSANEELGISIGFGYQDNQTFLGKQPIRLNISSDNNGITRASVIKFGQDYAKRDARGSWILRSNFNIGTGLFNATQNTPPIPDSRFWSWSGQIQRAQRLGDNNLLLATLSTQLSPGALLPLQQFYFSEDRTVRGYRQNARFGDNGMTLSIENRLTVSQNQQEDSYLQLIPFVDAGIAWNHPNNPNNIFLPRQNFLLGAGLGINWVASPQFNLRVDFSLPLINIQDRSTNLQDNGIYLRTNYRF